MPIVIWEDMGVRLIIFLMIGYILVKFGMATKI